MTGDWFQGTGSLFAGVGRVGLHSDVRFPGRGSRPEPPCQGATKPMQGISDWDLVARAQRGDMDAFAEIVRRYERPVIHFCQRMVGSEQDAEDLAQESFIRLHRYLARLSPRAKFSTAFFGIVRNLTLNHLRDMRRRGKDIVQPLDERPVAHPEQRPPDEEAHLREIAGAVARGIAALAPEHREVLLLREVEGLDYASIARIVKCRKGTVKSRIARAREQLRLRLAAAGVDLS